MVEGAADSVEGVQGPQLNSLTSKERRSVHWGKGKMSKEYTQGGEHTVENTHTNHVKHKHCFTGAAKL